MSLLRVIPLQRCQSIIMDYSAVTFQNPKPSDSSFNHPPTSTSNHIIHSNCNYNPNPKSFSCDLSQISRHEPSQSRVRLKHRQNERAFVSPTQIQSISKQIPQLPLSGPPFLSKPSHNSYKYENLWSDLSNVPETRLKHILPHSVRLKDVQGLNNILAKSKIEQKFKESVQDQKQVNKIKARLLNIQRHSYYMKLEKKCGIEKIRSCEVEQGIYGYVKSYKVSPRLLALSTKAQARVEEFDRSEFKGLIAKEFPKIVQEFGLMRKKVRVGGGVVGDRCDIEESIDSISQFEKRLNGLQSPGIRGLE